jgi:16S rRNA (adenine1518-N6/adenine1519-N6)-dimethyltransferase
MPRSPARQTRPPKLGQNFLADHSAARQIVEALGDISDSTVIEIGPGQGVLTELLAKRAGKLVAIELDRVLGAQLRMKFANQKNVEILEGNVLDVDFTSLMRRTRRTSGDIRGHNDEKAIVIGNLPYYITSPILLHLFHYAEVISQILVMVQREVAERIVAKPGGSEYGLLSATAQFYSKVEKLMVLPPGAFSPPPKVHSAAIRLAVAPQAGTLGVQETEFIDFLKLAFAQKRKTLVNNLKARFDVAAIKAALKSAGVKPDARAETVSLPKMASIMKRLQPTVVSG